MNHPDFSQLRRLIDDAITFNDLAAARKFAAEGLRLAQDKECLGEVIYFKAQREIIDEHFDVAIESPHGLHARPATALVEIAKGFDATVRIRYGDRAGDGKSLIALLNLKASAGTLTAADLEQIDSMLVATR
jgi:phosphotransferase system HPr (HPr) family protein